MKVKVLTTVGNAPSIEKEINDWLSNHDNINVSHIKQNYTYASDGQFHTMTSIWYTEE